MADDFDTLAGVSEEGLWERLGEDVLDSPVGRDFEEAAGVLSGRFTRGERARAVAGAWLDRNRQAVRGAICGNDRVRSVVSSDPGAFVEIAKVVGDALIALHLPIPIITLSALIARKGLDWICTD